MRVAFQDANTKKGSISLIFAFLKPNGMQFWNTTFSVTTKTKNKENAHTLKTVTVVHKA